MQQQQQQQQQHTTATTATPMVTPPPPPPPLFVRSCPLVSSGRPISASRFSKLSSANRKLKLASLQEGWGRSVSKRAAAAAAPPSNGGQDRDRERTAPRNRNGNRTGNRTTTQRQTRRRNTRGTAEENYQRGNQEEDGGKHKTLSFLTIQ